MTEKEVKEIKKSLCSDIDSAYIWVRLAEIGIKVGIAENREATVEGRAQVIANLQSVKQKISENVDKIMADINDAISKMS